MIFNSMKKVILYIVACFILTNCSSIHNNDINNDCIEPVNRFTTKFNAVISKGFITPITKVYEIITPRFLQSIINNFLANLQLPYNAICSILSLDTENTAKCLGSFIVNTAFSLGTLDVAKMNPKQKTLDDTFKSWKIGQGNYFVIPLIGPSTIRGTFAELASLFINPIYVITKNKNHRDRILISHTAISAINSNAKFYKLNDNLMQNSFDYYSALKSFYLQNLQKEINSDSNLFDLYE